MSVLRKIIIAILTTISISAFSQDQRIKLPVFGQDKIEIVFNNGLPLPAEDKNIKIEVAGLGAGADKTEPTKRSIFWIFGFTQKNDSKVTRIQIEELFQGKPARLVIVDGMPEIKNKQWSWSGEKLIISNETTPWLYDSKTSGFLFRFTIQFENGNQTILHQLSVISPQAKKYLFGSTEIK